MAAVSNIHRPADHIALRVPVIVLVLAATAVPVELQWPSHPTLDFSIEAYDILENIAGFVPVGIVLGELGLLRAVIAAALISTFAETSQFVMVHRDPSVIDIAANIAGALLGAVVSAHWKIRSPDFRINKWSALAAAMLALALGLGVWATSGDALSARGATSPGTLEAYWKFDESRGRDALDSSGHGLHGRLHHDVKHVPGVVGGAVKLEGGKSYIDFGHSTAFRLAGSMTISAWVNSSSFPASDAAVVSQIQSGRGYQLGTTVDKGPRTIGFMLTNSCGALIARYGATPLLLGRWYHIAGVYDAEAQTLDVYLDGKLDNGFLLGPVTGTQRSSRGAVRVGRVGDLEGYEFAGSIDEMRIYSFALSNTEIAADMRGKVMDGQVARGAPQKGINSGVRSGLPSDLGAPCTVVSETEDARIPGAVAVFGVLVAVAFLGLRPSSGLLLCLAVSFTAGLLLVPATAPTLPSFSRWMMPLVSLAGGASVAFSRRRQNELDH